MKITKITIIIIIFALSFVTAIENNKENVVQLGGRTIKSFDNEKMADNMQTFLRDIPRYDFSLQRISNTFAPLSLDYYEVPFFFSSFLFTLILLYLSPFYPLLFFILLIFSFYYFVILFYLSSQ